MGRAPFGQVKAKPETTEVQEHGKQKKVHSWSPNVTSGIWCTRGKISAPRPMSAWKAGGGVPGWAPAEPVPSRRKERSLFHGICSFQWGQLWVPLLTQLFHIILSLFKLCQVREDRTQIFFPPFLTALPPPGAGASVRSISSSCLSETGCSLDWTWQVRQWFNRSVAVKHCQWTTGDK